MKFKKNDHVWYKKTKYKIINTYTERKRTLLVLDNPSEFIIVEDNNIYLKPIITCK